MTGEDFYLTYEQRAGNELLILAKAASQTPSLEVCCRYPMSELTKYARSDYT